jgi:hypothetical protein
VTPLGLHREVVKYTARPNHSSKFHPLLDRSGGLDVQVQFFTHLGIGPGFPSDLFPFMLPPSCPVEMRYLRKNRRG